MEISKESLKILFWRTEFFSAVQEGGTASLHHGKIRGFQSLGHEVLYATSNPAFVPPNVKQILIPFSKFFWNFPEVLNMPYNSKSIKAFLNIIDKEKPDFFLQHHHDFHYGGAVVKKKTGIPFILHMDGIELWVKQNWSKLYLTKLLKWAEEIQVHNADAITVPSRTLQKLIVDFFGIPAEKIIPSPNGVEPDVFDNKLNGEPIREQYGIKDKFVIGFSGTFGAWHGIQELARAADLIKKAIPNAFFFLIGDGESRPLTESLFAEKGLQKDYLITGFLPFSAVPIRLAACDVLVAPSVSNPKGDFFNSPVKLFEYMSMGKPIVATKVGQQSEVFRHEYNALLVEEKNPSQLAEAISRIYLDKELRKALSKNSRDEVMSKYTWRHHSALTVDAFHRIMAKREKK